MATSSPQQLHTPAPAIELGEDMVVSDDELDRIYGTDHTFTSPASLMNAADFDDDGDETIDTVPDWLSEASRGDRAAAPHQRFTALGRALVVLVLIALGGASYTHSDTLETVWHSGKMVAAKYLSTPHAQ